MWLLKALHTMPLSGLFISLFGIGLTWCLISLVIVRFGVRRMGLDHKSELPVREALFGGVNAMFALLMAFSGAEIWNDRVQAQTTVQEEASALENVLALAGGLPPDLATVVRKRVKDYARQVVTGDWPAMQNQTAVDSPIYEVSDRILIDLISLLSIQKQEVLSSPVVSPLLGEIDNARRARLARIAGANAGVTTVQWIAMATLAASALFALALVHNHYPPLQAVAMLIYTLAAVSAFFVILALDRPFVGSITVNPTPLGQLTRSR